MYEKLMNLLESWEKKNPWTNVYGLTRSIIALSSMLTLIFNPAEIIFRPAPGVANYPLCQYTYSAFCLGQNNYVYLNIIRWVCILLLFLVVIGWRPRITGIIHWFISYSMQSDLIVIDGGEQVAAVLTFLLLPITLTDSRKWHWSITISDPSEQHKNLSFKVIAFVAYFFFRLQIAILYFHSVISKIRDKEWIDGTAVYYYVHDKAIGFNSLFTYLSQWFSSSKLIVIPTWGTLIVQMIIFGSLFAPKKYWRYILIIAISMHEIFALFLGLISFSMIMMGALILFLTPIESNFTFLYLKQKEFLNRFKNQFKKKRDDAVYEKEA
jgi:antimicrobial peptide system SdpB family protein